MLVFESIGIIASALSLLLSLYLLWKGKHPKITAEKGKKIVLIISGVAIISITALSFLSYALKTRINTKTISDVIHFEHDGIHEVHYQIPFKYPPYIKISQTGLDRTYPGPYIKTQDKYGFQVWTPKYGSSITWRAEGIIEN